MFTDRSLTVMLRRLAFVNGQATRGGDVYAEDDRVRFVVTPILSGTADYDGGLCLKNCASIGLCASDADLGLVTYTLTKRMVVAAAEAGAQLVALAELFNVGCPHSDENFHRTEPPSGPAAMWMRETAAHPGLHPGRGDADVNGRATGAQGTATRARRLALRLLRLRRFTTHARGYRSTAGGCARRRGGQLWHRWTSRPASASQARLSVY